MNSHIQPDLQFDAELHRYKYRGCVVPSVTQVLSNVGVHSNGYWTPIGFNGRFGDEAAAEFGTAFHKIAAAILTGKQVTYPEEMEDYVTALRTVIELWDLQPIDDGKGNPVVEYPMFHAKYGYCGTPDVVGRINRGGGRGRELCILDWKTSTAKSRHWSLQLSAYAELARHVLGLKEKSAYCAAIMVDAGDVDVITCSQGKTDWPFFQSCLNVYKLVTQGKTDWPLSDWPLSE